MTGGGAVRWGVTSHREPLQTPGTPMGRQVTQVKPAEMSPRRRCRCFLSAEAFSTGALPALTGPSGPSVHGDQRSGEERRDAGHE